MKNILMNDKKGSATQIMVAVLVVILVLGAIGGAWYLGSKGAKQNTNDTPGGSGSGGVVDCGDNEPYVDNSTFNAYAKGTGVSVTYYYTIEGSDASASPLTPGTSGTAFKVGDKLKILSTASGYLDTVETFEITKCGSNKFSNYVYATDGGTIDILDQNLNAVTDGVATTNTVNLSDGGTVNPLNFIVRIDGVSDESTGQLYVTVEGNDTEVDKFSISAKSTGASVVDDDADTLKLFATEGTGSTKQAFIVDEVLDGGQDDYNIKVTPESGATMGGGATTGYIYVNAYEGEWFIDDDGSFAFGWEDSDGTSKTEGAFTDHDALIS